MIKSRIAFVLLLIALVPASRVFAQTTEFVYQGQLQSSGSPANGNFDFEFLLYDAISGGSQIGSTLTKTSIPVASGIFSAKLNFGNAFSGADCFIEIHVRPSGTQAFTTLTPRQQLDSVPYAITSLNAQNATRANNADDSTRLGGTLPSGFIQNRTTTQQANSNFNISGNGIAGGSMTSQRFNLPSINSVVPVFGERDANHFGLCGADGSGVVQGCSVEIDLTNGNVPGGPPVTIRAPTLFSTNVTVTGQLAVNNPIPLASVPLCISVNNVLGTCGSSLRFKKDVETFTGGLDIVNRLRPISFTWKDHPENDLGLGAEEVAKVEPRLTFTNANGEVNGVKYGQLNVVLINAIKEQQTQIEAQAKQIAALQSIVCRGHRRAAVCRKK